MVQGGGGLIQVIALIITYFVEMLIEYMFFNRVAAPRERMTPRLALGTLLFESCVVVNFIFGNSIAINAIYFFSVTLIFSFICFVMPPAKRIFYSILLYGFSALPEFGTIFVISSLLNVEANAYNADPALMILMGCVSKLLYFIICLLLLRFIERNNRDSKFPFTFYIYPIVSICFVLMFWILALKYIFDYNVRILMSAASLGLLVATVLLFVSYQNGLRREREYSNLRAEHVRENAEQKYYCILEEQNKNLMNYVHDMKNHLNAIRALNTDERIDGYLDKMLENLMNYSASGHSGNRTLDVIFDRYRTECKMRGISFSYSVYSDNLTLENDFDLVTLMGNLLNNAIESAEKSKRKMIEVETHNQNGYSVIVVSNSCDKPPKISKNELLTSKDDDISHGLGTKSIRKTVKKYGGDVGWEYDERKHVFTATLNIRLTGVEPYTP